MKEDLINHLCTKLKKKKKKLKIHSFISSLICSTGPSGI